MKNLITNVICTALLLAPLSVLRAEILFKSGEKVAFLGDSITAQGWSNAHGYVKLVVAGLDANGVTISPIPAGVGGHKSNDMLARLKRDVIEKKPDWVTVSCGMNDVIHGEKGVPLHQYKTNMTDIVNQCQAAGIKVAMFTTTTAGAWDSTQSKQLGEYSDFLRELAQEKRCLLIDLYPVFVETLKKRDTLRGPTGDGVHMTPEGNMLIARTVLAGLGLNESQLAKAHEAWLDLPAAGTLSTRADIELNKKFFTATCELTLRERERVLDAAAAAKRPTLSHWSKELLLALMKRKVKPEGSFDSLDALFASEAKEQVQTDLQQEFTEAIRKITSDSPVKTTVLGVAHVGGLYHFSDRHFLDEGAKEIDTLGAKCIKVYLTLDTDKPAKDCYAFGSAWPECQTLKALAASPPFQRLFAMRFETYLLTAFRAGKPAGYWKSSFTADDAKAEEAEFYELTRFLLQNYRNSGKTFLLQNWEGDWAVRERFDPKTDPAPAALDRMTEWLLARQRGVDRARRDESATGVNVLHAVEVCLLRGGMDEGRPCVANRVVPRVAPDVVSYSCWELQQDPALLRRGLDWLAKQTPARPPFGNHNIIIGEFGSPENVFAPDKQRAMIEGTIRVARDFGCPLAIFWQVYCNEAINRPVKSNQDVRGFGLVRPDGTHTLAWELLRGELR